MNKVISREAFDAVIFDLDGVITRTEDLHFHAWKRLFDGFLRRISAAGETEFKPFTAEDYRRYVDGRPRYEGVSSFLGSRGISLPPGDPDQPPGGETVIGLGNRKNELFQEELDRRGPEVLASSIRIVRALRGQGVKIGLVSSSRNLVPVIRRARIEGCFDAKVDGLEIESLNLRGKPAPDAFCLAADRLGVSAARSVVVEDSRAGVQAARHGGFGLVIGISRHGDPESLRRAGADIVVADLADVRFEFEKPGATAGSAELPSALGSFDEIAGMVNGRQPALFLDYDGTLTTIVRDPAEAVLTAEMREIIIRLAREAAVAVISGRDLMDVRQLVGLENISYAGSHGFDIAGPADRFTFAKGAEYLQELGQAERKLREKLSGLAGIRLERKKFVLAVHFREADEHATARLGPAINEILADHPGLRKTGGKKIIELRPAIDWDKGRAICWLLERLGLDRDEVMPVYLGDDLTDEDAFLAIREKGLGILVRDEPRPTAARYGLDDTGQVREFLERLAALLEGRSCGTGGKVSRFA